MLWNRRAAGRRSDAGQLLRELHMAATKNGQIQRAADICADIPFRALPIIPLLFFTFDKMHCITYEIIYATRP